MERKNKENCLKIAIVSGAHFDREKGGAEYQLLLLGKYLVNNSHKLYYIFRDKKVQINSRYGIINLSYKFNKFYSFLFGGAFFPYVFQVWHLLIKVKPHIIIVRPGNALVGICALYCKVNKAKMIWHIAGRFDVEKFKWLYHMRILTQFIERKILDFGISHSHFIIGQAMYQDALLYQNFNRKCDAIIPNFHPVKEFSQDKDLAVINVLWVANYKKNKQPEMFVQLAEDMKEYANVKFYMLGRPNHPKRLTDIINKSRNLEHLGELTINQVLELMKNSHILINTSISEGYPNTFIQAWLNKMVVLSIHANPDNVLTDLHIGYETGNYENLLKTLKMLIDTPEIIIEKGKLSYQFAESIHSLDNLKHYEKFIVEAAWNTK